MGRKYLIKKSSDQITKRKKIFIYDKSIFYLLFNKLSNKLKAINDENFLIRV